MELARSVHASMPNNIIESMMYGNMPYILDLPQGIVLDESYEGMTRGNTVTLESKYIAQRRYHTNIRNLAGDCSQLFIQTVNTGRG